MNWSFSILIFLSFYSFGFSQTDSSQKLVFSGFIDSYYYYNLNEPKTLGNLGTTGVGRVFDTKHNHISFNVFQIKSLYNNKNFELVGDLLFGPGAELAQFGNSGTSVSIKQAFVSWSATKRIKFTVGQFGTHIGYEVVDVPENFNYSLSNLFANGPFYHMGGKIDFTLNDKWSFMAGLYNGWDHIIDNNNKFSYAGQIRFAPNNYSYINLNYIGGDEDPSLITGDTLNDFKQMVDLTTKTTLHKKLNVALNAAFGSYHFDTLEIKNWGGVAVYLDYPFLKRFSLGVRAEYFDDASKVQYIKSAIQSYTLTGNISLSNEHLLIKPEVRHDIASSNIYQKKNSLSRQQTTIGVAVVGKF